MNRYLPASGDAISYFTESLAKENPRCEIIEVPDDSVTTCLMVITRRIRELLSWLHECSLIYFLLKGKCC